MNYRHEWKHEINLSDFITVSQVLGIVAQTDDHAVNGCYRIRSLYFDNLSDKALREKLDGVNKREKFRIRYYKDDISFIRLEKKSKYNGMCSKETAELSENEVRRLLDGDYQWMPVSEKKLVAELYTKMMSQGLKPKTIVEYVRRPFVYPAGNVRVTLDYDLRTGLGSTEFLNPDLVTVPAGESPIILEVKWDEFLPDIIRETVGLKGRRVSAFSKYAACRIYD